MLITLIPHACHYCSKVDLPDSGERLARVLQFIQSVDNRADDLSISKPLRNDMLRWVRSPTERTSAERLGGEQKSLGQLFRAPNVYPRCRGGVCTNRCRSVAGSACQNAGLLGLRRTLPSSSLLLALLVRHRDLSDQRSDTRFRSLHIASACSLSEGAACQAMLKSLRRPGRARLPLGYFQ